MKTNTKIFLVIVVLLLTILTISTIKKSKEKALPEITDTTMQENTSPVESLSWRFEDGANNLDGIPGTKVLLNIEREDGSVTNQLIDEVDGSCNEIDPTSEDTDIMLGTAKIQCYSAGFGQWYKITKDELSYKIQRKNFEEGLPDYTPPDYQYEVIFEIPLI